MSKFTELAQSQLVIPDYRILQIILLNTTDNNTYYIILQLAIPDYRILQKFGWGIGGVHKYEKCKHPNM